MLQREIKHKIQPLIEKLDSFSSEKSNTVISVISSIIADRMDAP